MVRGRGTRDVRELEGHLLRTYTREMQRGERRPGGKPLVAKAHKLDPAMLRLGSEGVRGGGALQAGGRLYGPAVMRIPPSSSAPACSGTSAVLLPSGRCGLAAWHSAGRVSAACNEWEGSGLMYDEEGRKEDVSESFKVKFPWEGDDTVRTSLETVDYPQEVLIMVTVCRDDHDAIADMLTRAFRRFLERRLRV